MLCKYMELQHLEDSTLLSAIWYSNCYVLEVNQNRIQAGRTSVECVSLSSSENHNKNGTKAAHGG
jgi:hypothetical protein